MTIKKRQKKAVALKYSAGTDKAPKVTAGGKGETAEKIIRIARQNNIHIHNDPDLVEVLSQLDINDEIPPDLYIVVAELLSFVYSLGKSANSGKWNK